MVGKPRGTKRKVYPADNEETEEHLTTKRQRPVFPKWRAGQGYSRQAQKRHDSSEVLMILFH